MPTIPVKTFQNGVLVGTRQENITQEVANRDTLLDADQIASAIQNNIDFLALASPTNAQTLTQVQRLTRQVTRAMRLIGDNLDDTAGT